MLRKLLIFIFRIYSKRVSKKFRAELKEPMKSQEKLKKQLSRQYYQSQRFKKTGILFDDLPVSSYDSIEEFVDGGLFCERVICFEETSGSSGQSKRIPYNSSLLKSFSKMFVLWCDDILENIQFNSFKFYFSITPQFHDNKNNGLEDDSDYLGGTLSYFSKSFYVKIPNVSKIRSSDEFLMKLSLVLISNRDLEIISIWSPTYLLSLIDFIKENENDVKQYLKKGEFLDMNFEKRIISDLSMKELFPSLKFISSWGSAGASKEFEELVRLFPHLYVQKKGLLATEAPMTIPLFSHKGGVPLIDEVFFEFFDEEDTAHDISNLDLNSEYRIVISQKGGLLRYDIKDCVKVSGMIENTPLLEFVGRRDAISDLCGEKIHERDVILAIENTPIRCLIPCLEEKLYYCVLDQNRQGEEFSINEIEQILRKNIHYHNARELKQLGELKVLIVDKLEEKIVEFHESEFSINSGDLKVSALYYRSSNLLLSFLKGS